ncbi:hypothetical protein [Paenibacillus xanthanilyticus]|uniref:Prefoldin subunit n=1 Tax=Paenibacillus xanthanilyticus TaxID=1783531 RepID=A0ABV8KCG7_9BACL
MSTFNEQLQSVLQRIQQKQAQERREEQLRKMIIEQIHQDFQNVLYPLQRTYNLSDYVNRGDRFSFTLNGIKLTITRDDIVSRALGDESEELHLEQLSVLDYKSTIQNAILDELSKQL